jgi:hypothetical protein
MKNKLTNKMLKRVSEERARQRKLLDAGKIKHDCASPAVLSTLKLPVLMEEVGEVAKEILEWPNFNDPARDAVRIRMQTELIQVAAVAVAWAESLEA